MADVLETLKQLQEVDTELFRLRREQQHKPLELERAKQVLAEEQANASAVEARLNAAQVQRKEKELELSTAEARVKKLQMQLFQIKTNKEYSAMQREIDQGKADSSLLEEEILYVLERIDQIKHEHAQQIARVNQQQAVLAQEEVRIQQALQAIEQQVQQLDAQRATLTPLVSAAPLDLYERILANRDGLALVPIVKESCGGCNMVQPPQVINEAHLKAKLATCDSCNRILYVDQSA